jgi:hypothetical protein
VAHLSSRLCRLSLSGSPPGIPAASTSGASSRSSESSLGMVQPSTPAAAASAERCARTCFSIRVGRPSTHALRSSSTRSFSNRRACPGTESVSEPWESDWHCEVKTAEIGPTNEPQPCEFGHLSLAGTPLACRAREFVDPPPVVDDHPYHAIRYEAPLHNMSAHAPRRSYRRRYCASDASLA